MRECVSYPARNHMSVLNSFITPDDIAVINVAEQIESTLVRNNIDDRVVAAFNFVALNVTYVSDRKQFGREDWWQYPNETLGSVITGGNINRLYGDCEDSSFLLASLLIALDVPSSNVRVGISEVHAWTECKLGNTWYLFETTDDKQLDEFITAGAVVGSSYVYDVKVYVHQEGCSYGK